MLLIDSDSFLQDIPLGPGVYIYKDAREHILYIGKAKDLRKRVGSYFRSGAKHTPKTKAMLNLAQKVETLSTATEKEALLLEASLIKKHKPRYNVVLKDDKQYVLFRLDKKSEYPRLTLTRRVTKDGSIYYGPFTSAFAARSALKAVHKYFPLRRCTDRAFKNRVRPCLYYDMKQCLGPCVLDVPAEEYGAVVRRVEMLLAGRSGELIGKLKAQMQDAAAKTDYETAAEFRDMIKAVERTVESQAAVMNTDEDLDVVGAAETGKGLALAVLFVRKGKLLDKKTFFWPGLSLNDGPEAVAGFITQFYGPGSFIPERLLVPWDLDSVENTQSAAVVTEVLAEALSDLREGTVRICLPKTGVEKQLTAMARANACEAGEPESEDDFFEKLAPRLGAVKRKDEPLRIEAVDVSHTGGKQTRVGMVVFEDGEPRKEHYRVYGFDDVETPGDDYGVLAAWTRRRINSGPPWPDILLIDGGKGQVAAVERALEEEGCKGLWASAGIAKAAGEHGRPDRSASNVSDMIFLPGRKNPLNLKPGSKEMLFLQRIRNTVHTFAVGRHRRARSKTVMSGELQSLPGIGPKTARLLWDHFPSVQAMVEASAEELQQVAGLGKKRAHAVHEGLRRLKK